MVAGEDMAVGRAWEQASSGWSGIAEIEQGNGDRSGYSGVMTLSSFL